MFHFAESRHWKYQGTWYRVFAEPVNDFLKKRDNAEHFVNWVTSLLKFTLPVFLLVSFWGGRNADGISAMLAALFGVVVVLSVARDSATISWLKRAGWYAACGLSVFCGVQSGFSDSIVSKGYTLFLVCSVLVAFYFARHEHFRINPLDVIVLVGVGLILYLSKLSSDSYPYLGTYFGQIMLLLYSVELVIKNTKGSGVKTWPLLVVLLFAQSFSYF